jgi:hypothetical protein
MHVISACPILVVGGAEESETLGSDVENTLGGTGCLRRDAVGLQGEDECLSIHPSAVRQPSTRCLDLQLGCRQFLQALQPEARWWRCFVLGRLGLGLHL